MANRTPLIAGNWKLNKTTAEAVALATEIKSGADAAGSDVDVLVSPVFTVLAAVAKALAGSKVFLAGQNMHSELSGAYTGEIAPTMLTDVGCSHVILGHSERRQYFGETDEGVAKKTKVALDNGLLPISCVGETLEEREGGKTMDVVGRQVDAILKAVSADEATKVVIAYEPVWAIGTGKVATPEQAQEVHAFIRKRGGDVHGPAVADAVRILYGGSVKPDNVKGLMALPDVDGALVGGASLKADSFLKLVHFEKQ
jgi:triosephosphate isomerase